MKKKPLFTSLACLSLLASCGAPTSSEGESKDTTPNTSEVTTSTQKENYDLSGVSFEGASFVYDGTAKSIQIAGTLPEGVTVTYEGNEKTDVGEYEVTAHFKGNETTHNAIPDKKATLTITKATYDMSKVSFEGKTFTYDGSKKSIQIKGTLPEGVTVTYEGNEKTDVGTHEVIAHFKGDEKNYNAIEDKKANIVIEKGTLDLSSIKFENSTQTYDGTPKFILIEGELPKGVEVSYEGNGKINAGEYEITAHFTSSNPNYNAIPDKKATLTISKATFVPVFNDAIVEYDGTAKSISIQNELPRGLEVTYEGNEKTVPGKYKVTATFAANSNFEPIESISATMTIHYGTYVYARDDGGGATVTDNGNGEYTYTNPTSGILAGNNQNWGESGACFWEASQTYDKFSASGCRYIKADFMFEESVASFNLRFGSAVGEFYVPNIEIGKAFPYGRQVNFFTLDGQRVDRIQHNVWYTAYFEIASATLASLFTNGGSPENPTVVHIKNAECVVDIAPSVAPYVKGGNGTVSIATEEGREGSYKIERNGEAVINFFGITHSNSPEVNEYTGGFFDSDDNRYFVFDYFIDDTNYAWYLAADGTGYSGTAGRYCNKTLTAPEAKIYRDGVEVEHLDNGWNTCVVDMQHTGGGWTNFDLSITGNTAYLKNIYYATTNPFAK